MKKLLLLLTLLLSFTIKAEVIKLNKKNSINFNQDFNPTYVASKQIEAMKLCLSNIGSDIYITLYTPGGSISAGQLFYDTLNALPCNFHTITIFAASMGYQTVQNLGNRYILPSGKLMSHRASISGLSGELGGELDKIVNLIKTNVREMEEIASSRVGISLDAYKKLIRDELWLTGKQAVIKNHADKLALAICEEDLMSERTEIYNTFFGRFKVTFSNCPIVTAPIKVESVDGYSTHESGNFQDYYQNISKRVKWKI